jgi:FkbM family methyltransferase
MKILIQKMFSIFGYRIASLEHHHLTVLKKLLKGNQKLIIFDVGAHYGETERGYSKIFKNSAIYCFEPFESSFLVLKNNVGEHTKIYNIGFSDIAGELEFQSNYADATNSLLSLEKNANEVWGLKELSQKGKVKCQFDTIDGFILTNDINQIDLLKLDVQGAEYKVLLGAKKSLSNQIIKNIYMEIILAPTYKGQWGIGQYIKEMNSYGYELYGIYNMYHDGNGRLLQIDAIFSLEINQQSISSNSLSGTF